VKVRWQERPDDDQSGPRNALAPAARRSRARSSHRGGRVDPGWFASGPGPTGLVISTELANRLRLPRSRLRELRDEDHLRDVREERVQPAYDVPLDLHPQSFGQGLRGNELRVSRDGVHDEPMLVRALGQDGDGFRVGDEVGSEDASNLLRARLDPVQVDHVVDAPPVAEEPAPEPL